MSRVRIITLLVMFLMECVLAFSISAEGRLYRSVPLANVIETSGFTVYDIKRTDDGFVWFATDRGLIRFDGEHGVRIRLDDGHGAAVSVSALTPAGGGSLIAATSQGVYRLQPAEGRYMATRLLDGSVLRATCGLRGGSGISLIGSEEGLVAFLPDGKTKRIKVGRDMLDLSNSTCMYVGTDGWTTDAYMLAVTYDEGADPATSLEVTIIHGCSLKNGDHIYHSSLSKSNVVGKISGGRFKPVATDIPQIYTERSGAYRRFHSFKGESNQITITSLTTARLRHKYYFKLC